MHAQSRIPSPPLSPSGAAAAAAVVQVYRKGVLALCVFRAFKIPDSTNVVAELEAASLGPTLLIDWSIRNGICATTNDSR